MTAYLSLTHCTGLRSVFLLLLLPSLLLRLPPLHKLPQLAHIWRYLAEAANVPGDLSESACHLCHQRVGSSPNASVCLALNACCKGHVTTPAN